MFPLAVPAIGIIDHFYDSYHWLSDHKIDCGVIDRFPVATNLSELFGDANRSKHDHEPPHSPP
jgi:hypothetical protein